MFGIKKKYLPDNFEELIATGDISALKSVFDVCRIDARSRGWVGGSVGVTALHYEGVPAELVRWLVQQGLDVNVLDKLGWTPLESHIRNKSPIVETLLDLGANIDASKKGKGKPLHYAAGRGDVDNVRLLIERGADVHAKVTAWIHKECELKNATPLEYALANYAYGDAGKCDIVSIARTAELLLSFGAKKTKDMKEYVEDIGKHFEFSFNESRKTIFADYGENEAALAQLYEMFDATPSPKRRLHDGSSPIVLPLADAAERDKQEDEIWGCPMSKWRGEGYRHQFVDLWKYLVPPLGPAKTIQGEVIRITFWLERWIDVDVGLDWNDELLGLFDTLTEYFGMANPLTAEELAEVRELFDLYRSARLRGDKVMGLRLGVDKLPRLAELAVTWVLKNPTPIALETGILK